jgi:hypothetical protein
MNKFQMAWDVARAAGEEFFDPGERCIRKHKARHRVSDGMCVECVKVLERLTGGKLNDFTLINRRASDKAIAHEKMMALPPGKRPRRALREGSPMRTRRGDRKRQATDKHYRKVQQRLGREARQAKRSAARKESK